MKKRVFTLLLAAGLLVVAALTALTFPAAAQTQTVYVKLPSGEVVPVTVDVPPGSTLDDIQLPGAPVPAPPAPETTTPTVPTVPKPPPETDDPAPKPQGDGNDGPSSDGGSEQERSSSGRRVQDKSDKLAVQAATGDLDAIHDYTIAATEASVTAQLTVAVRNRAMEAFNEIMRMPIG